MFSYILHIIAFQLLFLVVYELLLKKETFFTWNRWYLLLTAFISLLLPFLKVEGLALLVPEETIAVMTNVWLPEVFIGEEPQNVQHLPAVTITEKARIINWWLVVYALGVSGSIFLLFRKYRDLSRLFRFRTVSSENAFRVIEVPQSDLACTFFNTIFLGDRLTEAEKRQILSHELVHVKQKHSLDLMFFELLKIVFWFNPLVYLYQSRIAVVHEYIADAAVVEHIEKRSYYEQLLNSAFNTTNISFINQFFNHSLIKKRIVMLQKSKSKTIAKFKYLVMLPLILVMLTYVACSDDPNPVPENSSEIKNKVDLSQYSYTLERNEELTGEKKQIHANYESFLTNNPDYVSWATIEGNKINYSVHSINEEVPEGYIKLKVGDMYDMYINLPNSGKNTNTIVPYKNNEQGIKGSDVPFAVIEEVPVFPGCEDHGSNDAKKECMSKSIQEYVNKNFNTGLGKELNLSGVNRIIVQFKIDQSGNVVEARARAPHPALEEEAIRVINGIPQMQPGKQKGEEVGVMYSLPIVFQVSE